MSEKKFKHSKRIQRKLDEIAEMSDEEILEKEQELYRYSSYNTIGGLILFVLCVLGFIFLVPYL